MKIAQVYNQQRSEFGGEETVIETVERVLRAHGHTTCRMMRSSRGDDRSLVRKARAAVAGVYNPLAYGHMTRFIERERPDVVHVHSVFPNLSPSVLAACRTAGVPTVFHVHSHILTCPNWYHLRGGRVCESCFGGREHWCLLTNCRGSLPESGAYALRSYVARRFRLFDHVSIFIAVSRFLKDRLVAAGYDGDRIDVVPNAVSADRVVTSGDGATGRYVAYAGRLSPEKGADTLIDAARSFDMPVRIAGDGPELERLRARAPGNVEFLGRLDPERVSDLYAGSRIVVIPSRSYETFSLTAAEAMMHGKPVVASRIGALPELIEDGVRGRLVPANDAPALAGALTALWGDARACERLGTAARVWAARHLSEAVLHSGLMASYGRARTMVSCDPAPDDLVPASGARR